MKIDLKDGISDELNTPITIKFRWIIRIVIASLVLGALHPPGDHSGIIAA